MLKSSHIECVLRMAAICMGLPSIAAAQGVPSLAELQQDYVDQQLGMFVHWNLTTFTNSPWGEAIPDSLRNEFNPTQLDFDQWAEAAQSAGMTYVVLTTKHHDGFALWDTSRSEHDIASTSWYAANGQPDIVADFVQAFRSRGMNVGLYYSVWDVKNGIDSSTNPDYATQYVKDELSELLTRYGSNGEISSIWTDGWNWFNAGGGNVGHDVVRVTEVYDHIKLLSPTTLLIDNAHPSKLESYYYDSYHNQVSDASLIDGLGRRFSDIDIRETGDWNDYFLPPGATNPGEFANTITWGNGWFWNQSVTDNQSLAQTLGHELDEITITQQRNATFLLNVPPDNRGLMPDFYLPRLADIGMALCDGNVALGKPTTQSSTYSYSGTPQSSSNAVDGVYSSDGGRLNAPGTLDTAYTAANGDANPWWRVDLEQDYEISEVVLYNRQSYTSRLSNVLIEILDAQEAVVFTSDVLNLNNVLGGPSYLRLELDEAVLGQYVRVSRTNLSGMTSSNQVLTLAEVQIFGQLPGLAGDYNDDGIVDAADYTVWRDTLGSTTDLRANGDNTGASTGVIDEADYVVWKSHFGQTSGSGSSSTAPVAIPEPTTLVMFLLAVGTMLSRRHAAGERRGTGAISG